MFDVARSLPSSDHLTFRTIAMPRDTNPYGDMFGGWLVSIMDLAAGTIAAEYSHGRAVTVAIDAMTFHKPVFVGDEVSCYAQLISVGKTSMKIQVETWAKRRECKEIHKVTEGIFTFVAIDKNRQPRLVSETREKKNP